VLLANDDLGGGTYVARMNNAIIKYVEKL
jgi:hypothetical protein